MTEGLLSDVQTKIQGAKDAWRGAKAGWQGATGAIPGAVNNYNVSTNATDVSRAKSSTANRFASQWIGTAQQDPSADPVELGKELTAYTSKLAGVQLAPFAGNPTDPTQVQQYMQKSFAIADRARMSGAKPTTATPTSATPPVAATTTATPPSNIIVPQTIGQGPRPKGVSTAAPDVQQTRQAQAATPPQLAQGVDVINPEPIMFKFNNKNYILGDRGQWVDSKTQKLADQTTQAFLDQQHDKFLRL